MQEQVLQKVKQYIAETEMIKQGCTVIAGVSGGPWISFGEFRKNIIFFCV